MQIFGFTLDHPKPVWGYRKEESGGTLKETLGDRIRKTLGEETLPLMTLSPPAEQLQSLQPGSFLPGLQEILFCKQWGEGKRSRAFANGGTNDFLNASLQLVL